ncbi:MAG: hypothetical protein J3Q66DRAFT_189204 [Benniella sp.]|nr:MAG: hypothetical protein J3Q66DRAFT_189204 [Benniella sp.]
MHTKGSSHEAMRERYRIGIISGPQLTDWFSHYQSGALLKLVETYTDLYMKRSFHRLHKSLQPEAVLFLGDLIDGGGDSNKAVFDKNTRRFERVFGTRSSVWNRAPIFMDAEPAVIPTDGAQVNITGRYEQRLGMLFDAKSRELVRGYGRSARLYVAGNHDVGFGNTLIRSSMVRYKQTFGSTNYEVSVGNHVSGGFGYPCLELRHSRYPGRIATVPCTTWRR